MMQLQFKLLDAVACALLIAAAVFSVRFAHSGRAGRTQLRITSNTAEYVYPLNANGRYSIPGDLGDSIIVIKDGTAYFEDSPCPNKTCAACAPICRNGDWIACLPNQVFIRVEGNNEQLDGLSF